MSLHDKEKIALLLALVDDMQVLIESHCGYMSTGIFPEDISYVLDKVNDKVSV